jgi:hypothetical protein
MYVCAGWNGGYLYFSETDTSLPQLTIVEQLNYKDQTVCLPAGTYTPFACGGSWPEEITWEIHGYDITGAASVACAGPPSGTDSFTVGEEKGYSSRLLSARGDGNHTLSIDVHNVSISHFGYSGSAMLGGAIFAANLAHLTMKSVRVDCHACTHTDLPTLLLYVIFSLLSAFDNVLFCWGIL